jgi:hypothetical protein
MAKARLLLLAVVASVGFAMHPAPAQAWWHGGIFIAPVPFVIPPVVPYYPPAYYPPPPPYYVAPPPASYVGPSGDPAPGQSCYAGAYVCPLDHVSPIGAPCTCPTNTGRVAGNVR